MHLVTEMADPILLFLLSCLLLIALIQDIRVRKIPNWLTLSGALLGMGYNTLSLGIGGIVYSLLGMVIGMAIWMLPHILGGMGAGDVKLMGAIGSFLGPKLVFIASLYTAIIGGVYALLLLAFSGLLLDMLQRHWFMLKTFMISRSLVYIPCTDQTNKPSLCYGVAIFLGTFSTLLWGDYIAI